MVKYEILDHQPRQQKVVFFREIVEEKGFQSGLFVCLSGASVEAWSLPNDRFNLLSSSMEFPKSQITLSNSGPSSEVSRTLQF